MCVIYAISLISKALIIDKTMPLSSDLYFILTTTFPD